MSESESEGMLSQDDINAALAAAGLSSGIPDGGDVSPPAAPDYAASVAEQVAESAGGGVATAVAEPAARFEIPELDLGDRDVAGVQGIDLLRDVELNVKIELGRSRMLVEDVLRLAEGAVVELDKLAGDPVDVFVNNRLVARGEVLVLNDNFCVRINEIVLRNGEESLV